MRITGQALGSFRLMFSSLLDCQAENAGQLHTPPHQMSLALVVSEMRKRKELYILPFVTY